MFSRFILKPSSLKFAALICTRDSHIISSNLFNQDIKPRFFRQTTNFYSTNHNGNGNNGEDRSHLWNFTPEIDKASNSLFDEESGNPDEFQYPKQMKSGPEPQLRSSWKDETLGTDFDDDGIFKEAEEKGGGRTTNEWATADGFQMWDFEVEEKKKEESVFVDAGEVEVEVDGGLTLQGLSETDEPKNTAEQKQLEVEEKVLNAVVKGRDCAFGDLLAASGITDEMLDSLISLKVLEDIPGLPPLHDIQDARYENSLKKSSRAEIERQKQEEVAKARVRQVDEKGRAYGTGRRKCSIARVWIEPGDGRFVVNDKEFDVYFPMLDHRATLLRPFTETLTLGKWDVSCTVKGGGVSGQVGAVRLGISRALQNWAPDLRPPLREAGFLTRDSRVVERKKPGKAKARKSFQWVKR